MSDTGRNKTVVTAISKISDLAPWPKLLVVIYTWSCACTDGPHRLTEGPCELHEDRGEEPHRPRRRRVALRASDDAIVLVDESDLDVRAPTSTPTTSIGTSRVCATMHH